MATWNGGLRFASDHTISHAAEAQLLQTAVSFSPRPVSAGIFDDYRQVFEVWFQVEADSEMTAAAALTGLLPSLALQMSSRNLDYYGYVLQQFVPAADGADTPNRDYVVVFRGGSRVTCRASTFEARDGYYQFVDHENRPVALFLRDGVMAIMAASAGTFPTSFGAPSSRLLIGTSTSDGSDEI